MPGSYHPCGFCEVVLTTHSRQAAHRERCPARLAKLIESRTATSTDELVRQLRATIGLLRETDQMRERELWDANAALTRQWQVSRALADALGRVQDWYTLPSGQYAATWGEAGPERFVPEALAAAAAGHGVDALHPAMRLWERFLDLHSMSLQEYATKWRGGDTYTSYGYEIDECASGAAKLLRAQPVQEDDDEPVAPSEQ